MGFPSQRIRRYESDPQPIDTTNGNTFPHGLDASPGHVEVRLVCFTPNNNYHVGEEIPLSNLWRNAGGENDGAPSWLVRITGAAVFVKLATDTISFFDPTAAVTNANAVTFTASQWRVKVYASNVYPLA